ncbi:MAG TPA: carboxyl transferase domain-containing protein [Usitatibacteraceae bacterium]|nr:carboxyl transferase domain-containing protein [Usitatibacteraceae bacterium]
MPSSAPVVEALRAALDFTPLGEPAGNVTLGKGTLDGRPVRVALVENRIASGSIGKAEVAKLVPLFSIAAREKSAVVLYLDSAGARISQGLEALGAFRRLFREALAARIAGASIAVVLGRNCYGGASMLAHVGAKRLFSPGTQLAMSGPSILARSAGVDALDEMFRAMADAAIGAAARAKASEANAVWTPGMDLPAWLRVALAPDAGPWNAFLARHQLLRTRLDKGLTTRQPENVRRKDLEKLFAQGYRAIECDGVITGEATCDGVAVPVLGLVGPNHVGAERAWRFADAAWRMAKGAPARVEVLLDCESHAARLDDERAVLTEFIVDMGVALAAVAARGTHVELTILDRAGGGVYVALAAPATHVSVVFGADIQVLPGAAVASILGSHRDAVGDISDYRRAGVADAEHKLGLPP